jgi:hypothetical protein
MTGSLCHRFGPGRLPCTERRDVGGGVAMCATALLVTVLWVVVVSLVGVLAPGSGGVSLARGMALFSPLAVLAALAFGTALWRYWVPARPDPVRGAIAGGLTAVLSLIPVAVAVLDFAMVGALAYGTSVLLTGWLAVPLGLFGGWYHERARRSHDADAGAAVA